MVTNVPKYMIATLVITGLYLSIEIPFSIHLVRILGGNATEADIDSVEKFGRLLTGFAVALAYVGLRTFPNYHRWGLSFGASIKAAVFRIVPIVALVYFGLHIYGEGRGMFSTGEQRKEAFISNLAKRAIAENGTGSVTPSDHPTWLATVSGLPALVGSEKLVSMSGMNLRDLSRGEAVRSVGTVAVAADAFSAELDEKMSDGFKSFNSAALSFDNAVASRESLADSEWIDFSNRLRRHFGNRVPRQGERGHAQVIKEMRQEGLPVASNFRLDDRQAFRLAVMRKVTVEAGSRFSDGIEQNFGKGSRLKPTSTKQEFFLDPGVQRRVRENLGGLDIPASVVLRPGMDIDVFEKAVYPGLIRRASSAIYDTASMHAGAFTSQADRDKGEAAFKAATLPATALLLSLAGALFHMYKFSGYFMLVFGTAIRSRLLASKPMTHVFAGAMLALAVFAMRTAVPVGPAPEMVSNGGGLYGEIVSAAVSLQPGMFLIGDAMASVGPWQVIGGTLPAPRLPVTKTAVAEHGVSQETTGSLIPVPEGKPVEMAEAVEFVAPVPVPRPR